MRLPDRTDRVAWANAAYDVAWRILHDRDAAVEAASHGLKADALIGDDVASAILLSTCHRAAGMLAAQNGERPPIDATPGLAFVRDEGDSDAPHDPVRLVEQAWGAAEAMGAIDASLVDLHLRFGVPAQAMAPMLRTDRAGAAERLDRLRKRLEGALASWMLWNDGKPRCDNLADELAAAPDARFGPRTGQVIAKHAVGCDTCRVAMEVNDSARVAGFASTPVLRAPAAVLDAVAGTRGGSSSVFVDAARAEDLTAVQPTARAAESSLEDTTVGHAAQVEVERESQRGDSPDDDPDDDPVDDAVDDTVTIRQPGIVVGILVGLLLATVIIGLVTAWAVTSSG